MWGRRASLASAIALACIAACGDRSSIAVPRPYDAGPGKVFVESCNGLDDDGDGMVDEDFRDMRGNYVNDAHCGACGHACDTPIANATAVGCALLVGPQLSGLDTGLPTCVARSCAAGFGRSRSGGCVPLDDHLCLSCREAADCGGLATARCLEIGGEARCARDCGAGCPKGYVCVGADHCVPDGESCVCQSNAEDFALACRLHTSAGDCAGRAQCSAGKMSACQAPEERCDGIDNDCDGRIDEGFVDVRGAYSTSTSNCGACGIDCGTDADAGATLTCGGDPFAPSCVTLCPDTLDGIQIGDHLDANRRIDDGCECTVHSLTDEAGVTASDAQLDANCDGADGSVLSSFYVTIDGDDSGPGSPTRPLRSIGVAVQRAFASIGSASPRPHVYVASGVYTETVQMRDGVFLHGGYRSDFLAQNESGFPVVVVAPANTTALGGAALVAQRAGWSPSLIEGFSFRGRDAKAAGELAVGVELVDPAAQLVLRALTVRPGKPGAGQSGDRGLAGASSSSPAGDGEPQRPAFENTAHACVDGDGNRGHGGGGGQNRCGTVDVSGGNGGSSMCPMAGSQEQDGQRGSARSQSGGGVPGRGGDDLSGPIMNSPACPSGVCCGLADFNVPPQFTQATAGGAGQGGVRGTAGSACTDPFGGFSGALDVWTPGRAADGGNGDAGGGGGGGGSGGGAEMTWVSGTCEFPDGLGGGGGGGGAGGCGGQGGNAGQSGAPAIGILIRTSNAQALPSIDGVQVIAQDGAAGGDGGAGGDGAQGGSGGFGGRVPDALRSTPPLAGPMPGERGGKGGEGGAGGAGGGGCGGSSIGIWLTGLGDHPELRPRYQGGNTFTLGAGGPSGRGGGGAVPAASGAPGGVFDVLVR